MSGKAVVDSIARNVARLVAENRRLRSENARLAASREKMRSEQERLARRNEELEHRLDVRSLAGDFGGGKSGNAATGTPAESKRIARARVNRLLREIDQCIALLGKDIAGAETAGAESLGAKADAAVRKEDGI